MRELRLVQIFVYDYCVYGLDKDGVVWTKVGQNRWERVNMEIKDKAK